jgi:hypothetical protein
MRGSSVASAIVGRESTSLSSTRITVALSVENHWSAIKETLRVLAQCENGTEAEDGDVVEGLPN